MNAFDWMNGLPCAITVCDLDGIVVEMNEKAAQMYRSYGGTALIGKSLLDCHPDAARTKLLQLLQSGGTNVYSTEKNGIKKLIYQAPWHAGSRQCGMVELALEIPFDMPHFIR